jgi:hypothetical protein
MVGIFIYDCGRFVLMWAFIYANGRLYLTGGIFIYGYGCLYITVGILY